MSQEFEPKQQDNIAADVDEVMRKYDRESNTRIWTGWQQIVVKILMVAFALYCIGMTLFSKAMAEIRLPLFMGFIVIAGFLNFPASKKHVKPNHMPWYDFVLMIIGAGCFFYFAINAMTLIRLSTRIQPIHVVIGCVGILVLIELCRRCVGLPILFVLGALLIYTFYNQLSYNASFYQALRNVIYKLFYTTSGIIGTPVGVCYTYIVLFIIFGAFLERHWHCKLLHLDLQTALRAGRPGGPAKVAVISSALCGMVSGSSVGNTVTTGSFTIPMMKKTGYKPEFAGAVEAAGLHRRPDHAAHHGRGRVPDGRIHGHPLCAGRRQGHPARRALLHRHFHRRPSGSEKARPQGPVPRRAAEVEGARARLLSAHPADPAGLRHPPAARRPCPIPRPIRSSRRSASGAINFFLIRKRGTEEAPAQTASQDHRRCGEGYVLLRGGRAGSRREGRHRRLPSHARWPA